MQYVFKLSVEILFLFGKVVSPIFFKKIKLIFSSSFFSAFSSFSVGASNAIVVTAGGTSSSSAEPGKEEEEEEMESDARDTACWLFTLLSDDDLFAILELLPLSSLFLSVAPTSRKLAALAEPHFRLACMKHQWRPPRRMADHPFVWRQLLRTRACAVCLGHDAHFPVRKETLSGGVSGGQPLFRLCQPCAKRDKVQQQITRHGYEVAAIGEHGKALFARQFHMPLFGHANGFSDRAVQTKVKRTGL